VNPTDNVAKFANQSELAKARETVSKVVIPDVPEQIIARAYMRLQCADVPREPWHWEVCTILQTPQISENEHNRMVNCGYDPTCSGWVIREGSREGIHIATCRTEARADEFVKLFNRPAVSASGDSNG
jgi:hypothetical protein